ncbi:MAG: SPW repeat protein [Bacteroidales bacterium]
MHYAWNSIVFEALIAIFSVFALNDRNAWEEWINMHIGIWVFVSPWIFGIITISQMWNHWIIGILIVVMSGFSIREVQKQTA